MSAMASPQKTVIRDVCLNSRMNNWTRVSVPPECSLEDIMKELGDMGVATKGKSLSTHTDSGELVVSYPKLLYQQLLCNK